MTFQRVASNGATSGIVLNTTGNANGALVVTGNGGTCSSAANCTGGAIQASTGPGMNLTSVPGGASLTRVAVTAGGDDGIRATTVNDIDLADSVVLNNGNSHTGGLEERGLDYLNVTGTPDILRTTVSGSDDSNANIRNTVAGTTTLGVNNSTFSDSKFNAGLRLRGEGPSVMNATVQNSTFSLNADPGFSMQTDAANTAQQTSPAHRQQLLGRQLQRRLRPAADLDQLRQRCRGEGHDQQQPGQVGRRRRDHRQLPGRPDRRAAASTPR